MPTKKQLQTLDKYVDAIHEILIDQINGMRARADRQLTVNRMIFVRLLGQMLYEAPKLHTGLVSVRLVEQKLNNFSTKGCLEHHQSRQKGGSALIDLIDKAVATGVNPTKKQIQEIALIYCQVHYTTAYENDQLRKHQRKCSSEAAYRRANIQLIEARDLFTKKGRHSQKWKEQMRLKYQPIVDAYNNPVVNEVPLPELPIVIN
jgi:hypothetical protein